MPRGNQLTTDSADLTPDGATTKLCGRPRLIICCNSIAFSQSSGLEKPGAASIAYCSSMMLSQECFDMVLSRSLTFAHMFSSQLNVLIAFRITTHDYGSCWLGHRSTRGITIKQARQINRLLFPLSRTIPSHKFAHYDKAGDSSTIAT